MNVQESVVLEEQMSSIGQIVFDSGHCGIDLSSWPKMSDVSECL